MANARNIMDNGFQASSGGYLGKGVYGAYEDKARDFASLGGATSDEVRDQMPGDGGREQGENEDTRDELYAAQRQTQTASGTRAAAAVSGLRCPSPVSRSRFSAWSAWPTADARPCGETHHVKAEW